MILTPEPRETLETPHTLEITQEELMWLINTVISQRLMIFYEALKGHPDLTALSEDDPQATHTPEKQRYLH